MNNYCSFLIKQLDNAIEKISNNSLRYHDLTLMQISVILTLEKAPDNECSLKVLEKSHHVAQPTMAGIIERLKNKNLIESYVSPTDRRIKIIHLTHEGLAMCKSARNHLESFEKILLKNLTKEEHEEFRRLLIKASVNLKN